MKNYLKKAISAVIALALAASFVPATLAANVVLTDVPETADYATAVNTLVALGVVNGYEDNTFLPDNNITRAEASKIIVAALNETASAEAMKGATKFSDIEAKHEWATGYINKGVSMGYINGMENNEFQPDGNVTYAQIVKMMLCAMGYEDYAASLAEQYGYTGANWYIPYTQLAADAGVTDGVYAGPNEAVTRAQVAQLVYNAIKAPMVKNVGITYTDSGKIVPKIQIQDGVETSVYYRSILTEKFDAYYVEGYVTSTHKDGTGLKADEVAFGIAKSKRYVEEDVQFTDTKNDLSNITSDRILSKVYVGDTDAAEFKGTYATAIIMLDEYDDWTMLDFTPSGKNKSYKFDLKDLDDEEYESADTTDTSPDKVTVDSTDDKDEWTAISTTSAPYIRFYVDGASVSTKYLLANKAVGSSYQLDVAVYVNGVKVTTGDPIWEYVINGDVGDVELVDTYKTDGKIDAIYVNSYISGMVSNVSTSGKITLDDADETVTSITLDEEDTTKEFHIYYNGEEITLDQLQEDDVITIAYDVTAGTTKKLALGNSKFYDVYVSRDVVTDTLKGKDKDDFEAKLGDTYYPFASTTKFGTFDTNSKLGDEYTAYLDAFGRIFKAEINSSAANWGIAERFTLSSSDDDYKLTIFTADGTTKAYYFDDSKATVTTAAGVEMNKDYKNATASTPVAWGTGESLNAAVEAIVYSNVSSKVKAAIDTRVITYKVSSSSGMITELNFMDDGSNNTLGATGQKEEFRTRTNAIGSIKMGEATKVIDATKYTTDEDLFATTIAGLTDEVEYKAYAYGKKIDGLYPFVLITEGEAAYNAKSRIAVITEAGYAEETDAETGDIIYSISAMYGDNKDEEGNVKLLVSDDVSTTRLGTLNAGDVIYFKSNAAGYVTDFDKVFSFAAGSIPSQENLAAWSLVNNNTNYAGTAFATNITIPTTFGTNFSGHFTTAWQGTGVDNDSIQLIYGPILANEGSYITIGAVDANGKTNTASTSEAVEFDVANEVNVYTYDYAQSKNYRFDYSTSISAIGKSNIADSNYESDGNTIDWNKTETGGSAKVNQESVNFAFAVVVEDEIVDVFAFLAK